MTFKWEHFKDMDEAITSYIAVKDMAGIELSRTEAKKKIIKEIPKEQKYQDKIIKYLKNLPECIKVWKSGSSGPYNTNGIPDVTAIMKPGGIYFGFEVKRPLIGELSPLQENFIREMRAAGGHAYKVVCVEDVKEILIREGIIVE